MEFDLLRTYLLQKRGAKEELPFGPQVLVFKVMGKMFAFIPWEETPLSITLKCDPDEAIVLRHQYQAVQPGYHMNKRHWNTVTLDSSVPEDEIWEMIDNSYELVVKKLKKALRQQLQSMG